MERPQRLVTFIGSWQIWIGRAPDSWATDRRVMDSRALGPNEHDLTKVYLHFRKYNFTRHPHLPSFLELVVYNVVVSEYCLERCFNQCGNQESAKYVSSYRV